MNSATVNSSVPMTTKAPAATVFDMFIRSSCSLGPHEGANERMLAAIELRGRAAHDDLPLMKHGELVADVPGARDVVGHHNQGGSLCLQCHQQLVDFVRGDR